MTLTQDNVGLYAETLVRQAAASRVALDYSAESLTTLDGLLSGSDPLYDTSSEVQRGLVVFYAGCYLGEVLVRTLDAVWQLQDPWESSSLVLETRRGGLEVRPFEKLHRRLTEGDEGNKLSAYYRGILEHRTAG